MHLKAIIFDWAGTAVDFGSVCPVVAFQKVFSTRGVAVDPQQIHRFMGMRKREHIKAILGLPEIARSWELANDAAPTLGDVEALYGEAEKLIIETVHEFATPTPHLQEAVESARERGMKIGSTTGYTAPMMERLAPTARLKGFAPDSWVASDQVPQGRPWPWMIFKNMEELEVCPPSLVVKIGDTFPDVAEGLNAGAWTVMVVESSSMVGKSFSELEAMPRKTREMFFKRIRKQFAEAGAHFVINNLAELDEVLEHIESRLDEGILPRQGKHQQPAFVKNAYVSL